MANTQTLPLTQPTKKETLNPANVIGGLFEDAWEQITARPAVNEGPVRGPYLEQLPQMPEHRAPGFPSSGSIENFQNPDHKPVETVHLNEARAAVEEAQRIVRQHAQEQAVQTSIRLEVAGMPAAERNKRLHLSADLRMAYTNTVYHIAELYRQTKAEITQLAKQEKNTPLPSPAKSVSRDAQFEGAVVSVGGANVSLSPISGGPG